jgi:hypothetical protein
VSTLSVSVLPDIGLVWYSITYGKQVAQCPGYNRQFFALILVWFGAALEWGRTGCYITIPCGGFVFALILVWFGTPQEWREPVVTPSLQYAARVLSFL